MDIGSLMRLAAQNSLTGMYVETEPPHLQGKVQACSRKHVHKSDWYNHHLVRFYVLSTSGVVVAQTWANIAPSHNSSSGFTGFPVL